MDAPEIRRHTVCAEFTWAQQGSGKAGLILGDGTVCGKSKSREWSGLIMGYRNRPWERQLANRVP